MANISSTDTFYLLIKSISGDIIYPLNKDDLENVNSILACKKSYSDLVFFDDRWFEITKKENGKNQEIVIMDITKHLLDSLTNIFKYYSFQMLFSGYLEEDKESKESFAVIMADIDDFKHINDTYGHQSGDLVLEGIGEELENNFRFKNDSKERANDIVARRSGDEFVILLKNISYENALDKIELLKARIANKTFNINGTPMNLATMSFGMFYIDGEYYSSLTTNNTDYIMQDILNKADKAMCESKLLGKNRVISHTFKKKII